MLLLAPVVGGVVVNGAIERTCKNEFFKNIH